MNRVFEDIVKLVDKHNRKSFTNAKKNAESIATATNNIAEYAYYEALGNICTQLIIMREVLHSEFPKKDEE